MIRWEFVIRDNKFLSFSVQGHAGLAPAPHDVLCAAVSAMTQLVVNTLQEVFEAELSLQIDEEKPLVAANVLSVPPESESAVQGVLQGLVLQVKDLETRYPDHLAVKIKK